MAADDVEVAGRDIEADLATLRIHPVVGRAVVHEVELLRRVVLQVDHRDAVVPGETHRLVDAALGRETGVMRGGRMGDDHHRIACQPDLGRCSESVGRADRLRRQGQEGQQGQTEGDQEAKLHGPRILVKPPESAAPEIICYIRQCN